MKNLYESIFNANASAISDMISKKFEYEDKGDYEQAYLNISGSYYIGGYIIWSKIPKSTIHISSDMIKYLRKFDVAFIYICPPMDDKKLRDKCDVTIYFGKDMQAKGNLNIVYASKGGNLTIKGGEIKANLDMTIWSRERDKNYSNTTSIFDFINLSENERDDYIRGHLTYIDFNVYILSNINTPVIRAMGSHNATVTIYGDIFNSGNNGPNADMGVNANMGRDMYFGDAKVINKSNNAIFGL